MCYVFIHISYKVIRIEYLSTRTELKLSQKVSESCT